METGRVAKLYPGSDKKIRKVGVLIAYQVKGIGTNQIYRDKKCLYPLELHVGQIDDDPSNIAPIPDDPSHDSDSELDDGPT